MKDLPEDVSAYKRTPEFDETSVPAGLVKAHRTKASVWGKIVILEGELEYTINEHMIGEQEILAQRETIILNSNRHGVVEPAIPHQVKPLGEVKFYVEFYR